MDYFLLTSRIKKLVWILAGCLLFVWTVRGISLTVKDWLPQQPVATSEKKTPAVPDEAKTVGKQFLTNWFFTGEKESAEQKKNRLSNFASAKLIKELDRSMLYATSIQPNTVDPLQTNWVEEGKKALIQYRVQLADGREMRLQVPLVKAGAWMVDGIPALLPQPTKGNPKQPEAPSISNEEIQQIQQIADGFFDSWLSGRKDQNTRDININPTNLLQQVQGSYEGVTITPVEQKQDGLVVKATVLIISNGQKIPFEYLLEVKNENGQYEVSKILF